MWKPDDEEFFIGYAPPTPRGVAEFVQRAIIALGCATVIWATVLSAGHVTIEGGSFEFGDSRPFTGRVVERPYPALRVDGDRGSTPWPLLVAPGKHGAEAIVAGLDGRRVTFIGTRIQRGRHTMIEVEPASVAVRPGGNVPTDSGSLRESINDAPVDLVGEVVDSKCFLGVMVPGSGKTHKDCASLCLRGGIPPGLYVEDGGGRSALLLLTGQSGEPVGPPALDVAGEVIRARGTIRKQNGWHVLRSDPATWQSVDR